jgi:hypothetical protein
MSVAPEIARLAGAVALVSAPLAARLPAPPSTGTSHEPGAPHASGAGHAPRVADSQLTLGTLARKLRMIAVTPERWWSLVRFDQDRSVKIEVEDQPEYDAWLTIMPPGGAGQDCDCDVATIIAGAAAEGDPVGPPLRPGTTRVHGQRHRLQGHGAGYSITLHARARRQSAHR